MVAKHLKISGLIGGGLIILAGWLGIRGWMDHDNSQLSDDTNKNILVLRALERQNDFYRQALEEPPGMVEQDMTEPRVITRERDQTANTDHDLNPPRAVIIPHHLLAADLIKEALSGITSAPKLIVVISPDHFGQVPTDKLALANTQDLQTPFGIAKAWPLSEKNLNQIDFSQANFMEREHGLWGILPFLKFYFPKSEFLSLVLRNKSSVEEIEELSQQLKQLVIEKDNQDQEVLLVISTDFSHRQTLDTVQIHDTQSKQALKEFPHFNIDQIDNDCVNCWAFGKGFLGENNRFSLVNNQNSADFGGGPTEITSYITGYFVEKVEVADN